MVTSKFRLQLDDGTEIDLLVVENMNFGGTQSVIVYESPGTNGGTIVTTGRKNRTVTLSGRLLVSTYVTAEGGTRILNTTNPLEQLNEKKVAIETVRDAGDPINLISPLDSEDSGRYIIESFEGSLPQGQERYVTFTIVLQEYRQANIKLAAANLVNFQPAETLKQRARDRQFAS